jgi:RNA recognition motif-containing protein
MDTRLYIGNLHLTLDSFELSQLFEEYGTVRSAKILTERQTGRSRGSGIVEMDSQQEALLAMLALDGTECAGQILSVQQVGSDQPIEPTELEELRAVPGPRPGGIGDRSGRRSTWGRLS